MTLTFDQMKQLVSQNNKSSDLHNECVIAVCWKESSFDPNAQSGGSTAKGLMQMTNPAVDTVNNITPPETHFDYNNMFTPALAVQCGTYYLQWCFDQTGSESAALDKFAGVPGYSANVMTAEACLTSSVVIDPVSTCLKPIHPFLLERDRLKLRDNPDGTSRFTTPGK